jgi:hypothetical protein
MVGRDFRGFGVIADEADPLPMILHPGILGGRRGDLLDRAALDIFRVPDRDFSDAGFQQTVGRKGPCGLSWPYSCLEKPKGGRNEA